MERGGRKESGSAVDMWVYMEMFGRWALWAPKFGVGPHLSGHLGVPVPSALRPLYGDFPGNDPLEEGELTNLPSHGQI